MYDPTSMHAPLALYALLFVKENVHLMCTSKMVTENKQLKVAAGKARQIILREDR